MTNEYLVSLLELLDRISDEFEELREGIRKAIRIADEDPEMALTRVRKVLEYMIRDVYKRRINKEPGTQPLENLIQRLVREGYFPPVQDAYASSIRKLGNVGTHSYGEKVTAKHVQLSLTQLMQILEWYFENERPEGIQDTSAIEKERQRLADEEAKRKVEEAVRLEAERQALIQRKQQEAEGQRKDAEEAARLKTLKEQQAREAEKEKVRQSKVDKDIRADKDEQEYQNWQSRLAALIAALAAFVGLFAAHQTEVMAGLGSAFLVLIIWVPLVIVVFKVSRSILVNLHYGDKPLDKK